MYLERREVVSKRPLILIGNATACTGINPGLGWPVWTPMGRVSLPGITEHAFSFDTVRANFPLQHQALTEQDTKRTTMSVVLPTPRLEGDGTDAEFTTPDPDHVTMWVT